MQVSAIGSLSYQPAGAVTSFAKMKQAFQDLGSALESGSLSDAKEAMAQLQQNAPAQAGKGDDPIGKKMDALSKALDSGDLKAAQQAYADVKTAMSQRPSGGGGGQAGGAGKTGMRGAPPAGAKKPSGGGESSSSNKTYDKMDANKDGTVSAMEEFQYLLKHPEEAKQTSATSTDDAETGSFDAFA